MKSKKLAEKLADLMLQKKGTGILIMDLTKLTTITDYFVICSASSDTQVKAISDFIKDETKKLNERPWHNEGYTNLSWVLLDFVDVVAHIFLEETRRFYNLEGLWADAVITEVRDK
ncbi:MAG: Ribosomal silencing factor RsfS [Ignavibacteria bacterium]|nr:Ribosomal silencing factor RsfS [Ignavibacteria bacterium]